MQPNTVERTYTVEAQLQVTALDPATAQEAVKVATDAVRATLSAQTTPVTLLFEEQDGMPVLAET